MAIPKKAQGYWYYMELDIFSRENIFQPDYKPDSYILKLQLRTFEIFLNSKDCPFPVISHISQLLFQKLDPLHPYISSIAVVLNPGDNYQTSLA